MLPIIAIVGRPNVGKSTLFNRLAGERHAVTSPVSGTTRDRIYREIEIGKKKAIIVDTGGLAFEKKKNIEADVQTQARVAIKEANIILFVIDASAQLTAPDYDSAKFLRSSKKPIIIIAHKSDNKSVNENAQELFILGFGDPIRVSSIHNLGIFDLEDAILREIKHIKAPPKSAIKKDSGTRISIVGKPNVGKSSIINAILGEPRIIVAEEPGTTIDAIDTEFSIGADKYTLVDTAGIRKRGKRGYIEKFGVIRALDSISRSDVTCLVLDAKTGITVQDLHVAQYILDSGKGVIIAINKADLMDEPEKDQKKFLGILQYRMGFMPWAPVIFTSAKTRKNIYKILELSRNITAESNKKIPLRDLKLWLKTTIPSHPPSRSGQRIQITDITQNPRHPLEFTFSSNKPDLVHFSYRRFLENELRRAFGFYGCALRINVRRPD